jgi:hypothetical protein
VLQGHRPGRYQAAPLHVTQDYVASMSTYLSTYYSNISSIVSYFHNGIDILSDELCYYHVVMLQSIGRAALELFPCMQCRPLQRSMGCACICVSEHVGRADRRPTYEISKNLDVGRRRLE